MAFHEIRFPENISLGASGGPVRPVNIVELANGHEVRSTNQSLARRSYVIGSGVKTLDELDQIIAFFEARQGALHGFRFLDWSDHKSCKPSSDIAYDDQIIGHGDNVEKNFQLSKAYFSGLTKIKRLIKKPVVGSVLIGIGPRPCSQEEYTIEHSTGIVSFKTPPEAEAPIYAGFEFDVPVRFNCDQLDINLAHFQAGEAPNIPLIEVLES